MESLEADVVDLEVSPEQSASTAAICPVDRIPRRWRNKICVRIIWIGALNFLAYTLIYAILGGDAHNGSCEVVTNADGVAERVFTVRGHFIRSLAGRETVVSRGVWIYSYLHSISVFITSAAMIISMLVLARPHILATMQGGWISGRTFVRALGSIVVIASTAAVCVFVWDFVVQLSAS